MFALNFPTYDLTNAKSLTTNIELSSSDGETNVFNWVNVYDNDNDDALACELLKASLAFSILF